jgi:hypothetical protein
MRRRIEYFHALVWHFEYLCRLGSEVRNDKHSNG